MRLKRLLRGSRINLSGWSAASLAIALSLAVCGCKKAAAPVAAAVPEVVVTTVVQSDVPVYSEWVGTTEGFVNADIYPKITGYLLKQNYKDGDHVRAGQLLFQIDDREYKAALDQALGNLGEQQADYKKNQQDLARYKPLYDQQVISKQDYDHVNQTTRASAAAVRVGSGCGRDREAERTVDAGEFADRRHRGDREDAGWKSGQPDFVADDGFATRSDQSRISDQRARVSAFCGPN